MSNFLKLNWADLGKGLVMVVLGAVLALIYSWLQAGTEIDWNEVLKVALTSGLGYLLKNLFSDSEGNVLGVKFGKKQG